MAYRPTYRIEDLMFVAFVSIGLASGAYTLSHRYDAQPSVAVAVPVSELMGESPCVKDKIIKHLAAGAEPIDTAWLRGFREQCVAEEPERRAVTGPVVR